LDRRELIQQDSVDVAVEALRNAQFAAIGVEEELEEHPEE